MTKSKRNILIGAAALLGLVGVEAGYNVLKSPKACVEIENLGPEPIEDLAVACGESRVEGVSIAPGATAKVFVSGRGPGLLSLRFRQKGNALSSFDLPGFDPAQMSREGFRLMLRLRPNEVERFQDVAEPNTMLGRWKRDFLIRFRESTGLSTEDDIP